MTISPCSILIADDNEMNRWVLEEQLRLWSQDVEVACDGLEAWDKLQQRRFHIVFLDLSMPQMDGLTLMKQMRGLPSYAKVPIIAVTAHLLPEQRSAVMAQGFDDVLIKPVMFTDLKQWITRLGHPLNASDVDVYADILLKKVSFNRNLGEALLKKLLIDMPAQFQDLELALERRDLEEAKVRAHKIHGGFCFYGFDDFKELAQATEQALLDHDFKQAGQHLQVLKSQFRGLISERSAIFERLTSQGH